MKTLTGTLDIKTYMETPFRYTKIDTENKLISVVYYLSEHQDFETQKEYNLSPKNPMNTENVTGCVDITDDESNYTRYALFTYA